MKPVLLFCLFFILHLGKIYAGDLATTCNSVSELANLRTKNIGEFTKICNRLVQSDPACKKIDEHKRMKCTFQGENEILTTNHFSKKVFGCVKSFFWDSMVELGKFVIELIKSFVGLQVNSVKSMYQFLTNEAYRNKLIENSKEARTKAGRLSKAFLNSSAQYFAREYPRNLAKNPLNPLLALGKSLAEPLMNFMSSAVQSIIAEYVPQYQCMNGPAKLSAICRLGGEILMPPMILFVYLKHGIKGLNSLSKSLQITKLKNSFKVMNEVQDAKIALKFSKPPIVIAAPKKKLVEVPIPTKPKSFKPLTIEEDKINKLAALARTPEVNVQLDAFFESLKEDFGVNLKKLRDYTVDGSFDAEEIYVIGNKLHDSIKPGTAVHDSYLKLGYSTDTVKIHTEKGLEQVQVLRPLTDLSQIYVKAYDALLENLNKGLAYDDLILPALIFQKTEDTGKSVFHLVRPLLDDIPKPQDGWQISGFNAELSNLDFSRAIGSGRHPLVPQMYHHDLAHVADDIANPDIMVQKRRYYEREAKALAVPSIHADSNAGQYLNEFLITLNLKNRKDITRLLNPTNNLDEITRKQQLLLEIDKGELHKRLDEINNNFHSLFSCNGGGCLDGRSMHLFPQNELDIIVLEKVAGKPGPPINTPPYYLANNSFWGYVKQMDALFVRLKEAESKSDTVKAFKIKDALAVTMQQLEKRTSAALSNNVDSLQIWKDVNVDDFSQTQSYRFFTDVSKPGDIESTFLDGTFRTNVTP
jgi:hypothetical protein